MNKLILLLALLVVLLIVNTGFVNGAGLPNPPGGCAL